MNVCCVKMQCNIISSRCSTARHKVWYYTSSHTFILKKNLQGKQSTNMISASADVERHGCKDGGFWILHTPPFSISGCSLKDFVWFSSTCIYLFLSRSRFYSRIMKVALPFFIYAYLKIVYEKNCWDTHHPDIKWNVTPGRRDSFLTHFLICFCSETISCGHYRGIMQMWPKNK